MALDLFAAGTVLPAPAGARLLRDLAYFSDDRGPLHLDAYRPAAPTDRRPAVLLINGDADEETITRAKDWAVYRSYGEHLAARGIVGIAFAHHSTEQGRRSADVAQEIAAAIAYVREHASDLEVDPDRLGVGIFSAAGTFALAPLLRDRPGAFVTAPAGGAIGTETTMFEPLATVFAQLREFLVNGRSIGEPCGSRGWRCCARAIPWGWSTRRSFFRASSSSRRTRDGGRSRMEVVFAFAGIVLGWVLSLLSQVWLDRRKARQAARLINIELLANSSTLESTRREPVYEWPGRPTLLTSAWDAQAMELLGLLNDKEATTVLLAYHAQANAQRVINTVFNAVTSSREARDAEVRDALRDLQDTSGDARERQRAGSAAAPFEELKARFESRRRVAQDGSDTTCRGLQEMLERDRPFDHVISKVGEAAQLIHRKAF